ncbi:MAG: hypothetical protein E7I76_06175 [Anaerococcus vaginalis]|uniref:hypothetical protein n=1 Tax=Anaerococcus vaginalis TaxID=33037 RepID=UPI002910ECCF|nr:hypothetical protein [Anaerococcus vaginalis]
MVTIVSFMDALVSLIDILKEMFNVNVSLLVSLESVLKKIIQVISLNIVDFPWIIPLIVIIILTSLYLKLNKNK